MSDQTEKPELLFWEIPSDFRWLEIINCAIHAVGQEQGWCEEDQHALAIVGIEAVSNAVEHGNRFDSSRRVRVEMEVSPTRFLMAVTDEGPGVDPSVMDRPLPEPTPEDLMPRGRGFSIMKVLVDVVRFTRDDSGRFRVELEKSFSPAVRQA